MAETVSVHIPFVEVRRDGDKWNGYITQPWFRYLLNSNPEGFGTGTGVLHGNPSGAPTWGPVDLTTDTTGTINLTSQVAGQLPVANGGLGGISATVGGLLYFSSPTVVASSGALTLGQLVIGGGTGAPTTFATPGTTVQVLHGGTPPSWSQVGLASDVTGILPVANGGTGVVSKTGTGSVVLNTSPTLNTPLLNSPTVESPEIDGVSTVFGPVTTAQIDNKDSNETFVTGVATTVIAADKPMLFIAHDRTNGDMSVGVISSVGVSVFVNGIGGIAWTRAAGVGLQAAVTAGANPRDISIYAISVGTL